MTDALPLAGFTEIAMRAGVHRNTVISWTYVHRSFPKPVSRLHGVGMVFWWPSVENWLEATGRKTDAGLTARQVTKNGRKRGPSHR